MTNDSRTTERAARRNERATRRKNKKPMDKATKLTMIITAAITGGLLLMALIWASVVNLTPTEIERVVYKSGSSREIDTDNRAAMIKVASAMKENDIEKDDKFCLDYSYYSGSNNSTGSPKSTGSSPVELKYSATIYWRDGTVQKMDCMAKNVSSAERSQINRFRFALEDALNDSGSRSDYYDDYYYDYEL